MLRVMTKTVGRLTVDSERDYPVSVWNKIASDAGVKSPDDFSRAVDSNKVLQSALKGRPRIHKRLGATS
jgi:hypothetical protein